VSSGIRVGATTGTGAVATTTSVDRADGAAITAADPDGATMIAVDPDGATMTAADPDGATALKDTGKSLS
jgi:hypothetical protein